VRFTTFDDRNKRQLRENEVWALAEGDDSSLWIGTYGGGVSRFEHGRFTSTLPKTAWLMITSPHSAATAKALSGSARMAGVSRFKDGHFTNYTVKDGLVYNAVKALYADRDGSVWIGTSKGGITQFKDGKSSRQFIPALSRRPK
jgi:ligand-binding sensor domain-containing protein